MILKLQILVILNILFTVNASFKFTNVKCKEFDRPFATIPQCQLKLVRRGVVALNLNVTLHRVPVYNVTVNFEFLKKYSGYRPFMYNITADFCHIMRERKRNKLSFIAVVMSAMSKDTNINHTCPYDHDIIVRDLSLKNEMFKLLPLPGGDYLLNIRVAAYNDWKALVALYFSAKEYSN